MSSRYKTQLEEEMSFVSFACTPCFFSSLDGRLYCIRPVLASPLLPIEQVGSRGLRTLRSKRVGTVNHPSGPNDEHRDTHGGSLARPRVQDQSDDQTVQTQNLGENQDQDHPDEQPGLLSGSSDTGVTDDSDSETGGETGETDRETGSELDETGVEGHGGFEVTRDQDRDDQTVL
jgi:hypothetical protein